MKRRTIATALIAAAMTLGLATPATAMSAQPQIFCWMAYC